MPKDDTSCAPEEAPARSSGAWFKYSQRRETHVPTTIAKATAKYQPNPQLNAHAATNGTKVYMPPNETWNTRVGKCTTVKASARIAMINPVRTPMKRICIVQATPFLISLSGFLSKKIGVSED